MTFDPQITLEECWQDFCQQVLHNPLVYKDTKYAKEKPSSQELLILKAVFMAGYSGLLKSIHALTEEGIKNNSSAELIQFIQARHFEVTKYYETFNPSNN